jgi:hypothetical protein
MGLSSCGRGAREYPRPAEREFRGSPRVPSYGRWPPRSPRIAAEPRSFAPSSPRQAGIEREFVHILARAAAREASPRISLRPVAARRSPRSSGAARQICISLRGRRPQRNPRICASLPLGRQRLRGSGVSAERTTHEVSAQRTTGVGAQRLIRSSSESRQDITRTSSEHRQNIARTSSEHRQNIVRTSSKHLQNIAKTSSEHLQNITRTSSEHRQNIART